MRSAGWTKAGPGIYTRNGWTATRQAPTLRYNHRTGNHVWVRWWLLSHPDHQHPHYELDLATCAFRADREDAPRPVITDGDEAADIADQQAEDRAWRGGGS